MAGFWLGMSGVLGSLTFAVYSALPVLLMLVWLIITVFVPLSIYIHLWFPPRTPPQGVARRAGRYLLASSLLVHAGVGTWVYVARLSIVHMLMTFVNVLHVALLIGLAGSGWVLYRAYQHTAIPHTRRQIRLIAGACLSITLLWILLWLIPTLVVGHSLIQERWLVILGGAVPLAYLIGGLAADLYRVDHIATRFLVHLGTTTNVIVFLALITAHLALQGTSAMIWIAVGFVALYRPVQSTLTHLLPAQREGIETGLRHWHGLWI